MINGMSHDQTRDITGPRPARFDTTQWSVVFAAGQQASPASRLALAELCDKYWYPLWMIRSSVASFLELARIPVTSGTRADHPEWIPVFVAQFGQGQP